MRLFFAVRPSEKQTNETKKNQERKEKRKKCGKTKKEEGQTVRGGK